MELKSKSSNFRNENLNPCFDEGKLSSKCLTENNYNSSKCVLYFENYKNCLRFWGKVKRLRAFNKIEPFLPDKEEREKIKKKREEGIYVYQCS